MNLNLIQIYRYTLALSWIYHGVFPKIVFYTPMEQAITATLGFNSQISKMITVSAGVGEVVFGLLLFIFYKYALLIKINILALVGLLGYVAVFIPEYLVEAFNPVTTNIALIVISLALLSAIYDNERLV